MFQKINPYFLNSLLLFQVTSCTWRLTSQLKKIAWSFARTIPSANGSPSSPLPPSVIWCPAVSCWARPALIVRLENTDATMKVKFWICETQTSCRTQFLDLAKSIDYAHGLKIQGRRYLMFFAKIPRGVKDFRKNGRGGGVPPISGLIMFLLTSVLKFAWGGYIYPLPSPHLTPLCASMAKSVHY